MFVFYNKLQTIHGAPRTAGLIRTVVAIRICDRHPAHWVLIRIEVIGSSFCREL